MAETREAVYTGVLCPGRNVGPLETFKKSDTVGVGRLQQTDYGG